MSSRSVPCGALFAWIAAALFLSCSPGGTLAAPGAGADGSTAATGEFVLRYKPLPQPVRLKVVDTLRTERTVFGTGAAATRPTTETHVYHTEKVYRREMTGRPGGLTVRLLVESSRMSADGRPIPKDLGGLKDEDWIDPRGGVLAGHLGQIEDPLRPEMPLPEKAVAPGQSWNGTGGGAPGLDLPVQWSAKVREARTLPGGRVVVVVEIRARRQGKLPTGDQRTEWAQATVIHFDPARGTVLRLQEKTKQRDYTPARGAPRQILTRTQDREVRQMKDPPPR